MKEPNQELCRGCGAKIAFVKNSATGATVPVQAVRTTYALATDLAGDLELQKLPRPADQELVYVSHFETCPLASDFSKKERARRG